MRKLLLILPFILFADDKIDKILNYDFNLKLSEIRSPFYKKSIIKRNLKEKKKKVIVKKKNVIKYKYKLLSIMAEHAKVRITKYVNNSISNIEYVCLHKGVFINGCLVEEVGSLYLKMKCNDGVKILKLENKKIPCVKEIK